MIIIRTDAQSNRKALAGALSELFHEKPRYCGAPTFAYEFGVGRLARDASLRLVPSLNETAAERLAAALEVFNKHPTSPASLWANSASCRRSPS